MHLYRIGFIYKTSLTMTFCKEIGLDMPGHFPSAAFERFQRVARDVLTVRADATHWKEWGGASNLIAWRFKGAWDDWCQYKNIERIHGRRGGMEEVFEQDKRLFGMFSSGVSSLESACYSIAATLSASSMLGLNFSEAQQRRCSPASLCSWLEELPTADGISMCLRRCTGASEWTMWKDVRNRLAHRSNLPRIHNLAVGALAPAEPALNFGVTTSTPRIEKELQDFDRLHSWLGIELVTCPLLPYQLN